MVVSRELSWEWREVRLLYDFKQILFQALALFRVD